MTSTPADSIPSERIAVIGTGLIGTSIAMASVRVGCQVSGWDPDAQAASRASERTDIWIAPTFEEAVRDADVVVVCAPIPATSQLAARALRAVPTGIVTDVASIKEHVVLEVGREGGAAAAERYIGGHPMGGSERSGPEHASPSVVDGIVWVLTPDERVAPGMIERLEVWIERIGGRPVRMSPARHDRLVAFVSHLPQVASTVLMALAANEEADEPELLLLAAGGFRDLTRLASSNPALWSQILLANREAIAEAIELFSARLQDLRAMVLQGRADALEEIFDHAKQARLRLAAKPQVRSGVAVLQIPIPDRPGALAQLTSALADGKVNIEDLQIVHSHEGGRGTVHLTVAAPSADDALSALASRSFDPIRLA